MKAPAIKVTLALLRKWPLPDPSDSESKEDRGRVLVVGGSRETPGAVRLAGIAALRAGAGKLQIASGSDVAVALAIAMPEAKVVGLAVDKRGQIASCNSEVLKAASQTDALLIGPGHERLQCHRSCCCKVVTRSRRDDDSGRRSIAGIPRDAHCRCHPDPASRRDGLDSRYVRQPDKPPYSRVRTRLCASGERDARVEGPMHSCRQCRWPRLDP